MKGDAKKKVVGGKLIEVEVTYGQTIESAIISGDFFLHPEEGIEDLERSLIGLGKDVSIDEIKIHLDNAITRMKLELIGFTSGDLAELVRDALK